MAQWVKEPALALPWLRALLWHALDPLAWELPHATGSAKKKKKKKKGLVQGDMVPSEQETMAFQCYWPLGKDEQPRLRSTPHWCLSSVGR